jgi:hypothetical protein
VGGCPPIAADIEHDGDQVEVGQHLVDQGLVGAPIGNEAVAASEIVSLTVR